MKVRYHFPVKSKTRTEGTFPLSSGAAEIHVGTDGDGVITEISVSYAAGDPALWPTITETPSDAIKFSVKMHSPFLEEAQRIVRAAEGALSFYGVEKITWNEPKEEYIPESPEEESRLGILSMSMGRKRIDAKDKEPTPFSLIATALLRTAELAPHEVPLAFYRKGSNDAYEDRHIEACIDFLFMLEALFANGKFKKNQVISEFKSHPELISAIHETQSDQDLVSIANYRAPRHGKKIHDRYMSQKAEIVIERLVELRGFLHHNNPKLKDSWHPDQHDEYLADALFLQFVCCKIGLQLFLEKAFTPENEKEFLHCYELSNGS